MLNKCTRTDVMSFSKMKERYDTEYSSFKVELSAAKELRPLIKNIKIIIVLGTWCGDCQLQVPHFFKVTDEVGVNEDDIELICVDSTKRDENGRTDQLGIEKIPTFIFTKKDASGEFTEIGRIIESPVVTLEEDMIEILLKNK